MAAMWLGVVIACGVAASIGYFVPALDAAAIGARAAAFGAGGLIAMLTASLIPFSYDRAGATAGIWAVVGFALALAAA
jgi:ZIP family zinc transporter